jgi:predicted Zn finger-like uncharacterized protein
MDLYTRCPDCQTIFRVTTRQLQASSGQVRCGQCQTVFDAFATLTARDPQSGSEEAAASDKGALPAESPGQPMRPVDPLKTKIQDPRPDPVVSSYEWEFSIPEPPRHTAAWMGIAVILLLGLAVQAAYAFRMDAMVLLPQSRDYYVRLCELLGCESGLPKQASALHIDASDLNTVDPARPNEIRLLLSIRNRAAIELAYPAFELTLTNAAEQAIARRVFAPSDYLATAPPNSGIKAGEDLAIQLYLDTGILRASGYKIYLFYQ